MRRSLDVLAWILLAGIGLAVLAWAALPPPLTDAQRAWQARHGVDPRGLEAEQRREIESHVWRQEHPPGPLPIAIRWQQRTLVDVLESGETSRRVLVRPTCRVLLTIERGRRFTCEIEPHTAKDGEALRIEGTWRRPDDSRRAGSIVFHLEPDDPSRVEPGVAPLKVGWNVSTTVLVAHPTARRTRSPLAAAAQWIVPPVDLEKRRLLRAVQFVPDEREPPGR